jgi:hypothetical protein
MADDPLLPLLAKRPEIVNYGVGNMPVPGCDTWHIGPCWALHLYDYEATIFINEAPITIAPGMVTARIDHALGRAGPAIASCVRRIPLAARTRCHVDIPR